VLAGCGGGSTHTTTTTSVSVPDAMATPGHTVTAPTPVPPPTQPSAAARAKPGPAITQRPIPFPDTRRREMAAYSQRHYGIDSYALTNPHVIVEHWTATNSFSATYDTFAPDRPDVELHELPNVCSHFVIDTDGTIYELVPLGLMCRHAVGLNYTAIGIEHVGNSDAAVLGNPKVLRSSLALTNWLRCTYGIKVSDVIGHNESLSSPYHMERVARLRNQTHGDMQKASMDEYRSKLGQLKCG
jgi:beta-N-acetylhexosaminidase